MKELNSGMSMMLRTLGIDPKEILTIGENIGKVSSEILENQRTIMRQNDEILSLLKEQNK